MSSHSASKYCHHFNKTRTYRANNSKKALKNCYYSKHCPPFHVPSTYYNIIYVHRFTSMHVLDAVIQHFQSCRLYSICTKSFMNPSELSLIQIHTISTSFPSYVLFVHLYQLPSFDSLLFNKIRLLFQLLFSPNNILYSWGILQAELEHGLCRGLYSLPINAKCINLQLEFNKWHTITSNFCIACESRNYKATLGSSMCCRCKSRLPHDSFKIWSLKNAISCVTNYSLGKSKNSDPWNEILDPLYSTLPSSKLQDLIACALYDCLSVTYLRLPVSQCWSLTQLKNTSLHILLTDSTQVISYPELEYISDDELPPIVKPSLADNDQQ